jgi:uncharacterized protein
MKRKINIVYHSKDLDGLCCGFLAKKYYRELQYDEIIMIPWDYYDAIPEIDGLIVMLDVSFPKDEMDKIADRLTWIDHHKTAIDINNPNIMGRRRIGDSASMLAWEWFYKNDEVFGPPPLVKWIDAYDVWKKENDKQWRDVLIRQHHMRVALQDPSDFNNYVKWHDQYIAFTCNESLAYDTIININSVVAKRSFDLKFEGLLFNAANHQGNSESLKDSMRPEHDGVCLYYMDGKTGYVVVSLYGVGKDIDLSAIALKYGGGGHRNACGFKLNNFDQLIK